jgi:hypothetical protein
MTYRKKLIEVALPLKEIMGWKSADRIQSLISQENIPS